MSIAIRILESAREIVAVTLAFGEFQIGDAFNSHNAAAADSGIAKVKNVFFSVVKSESRRKSFREKSPCNGTWYGCVT